MAARAVFLDRDGVLSFPLLRDGKPYSARSLEEFRLIPESKPAIENLSSAGFLLFVVTNQPDVARGSLALETLDRMHEKLIAWAGGREVIRDVYVCPHDDAHQCGCRKPNPGLLLRAQEAWRVDLTRSFVVGDREVDIEAGRRVGAKAVLIDAPYNQDVKADCRAKDLNAACRWILTQSRERMTHEPVS